MLKQESQLNSDELSLLILYSYKGVPFCNKQKVLNGDFEIFENGFVVKGPEKENGLTSALV